VFVALGIQQAMACAVFSSAACLLLQYFSTLSHKRHDFRQKKLLKLNVCFDFFYNVFPSRSLQTERRTDMTKLMVAFRNFAHTPNDEKQ
jgi:hypothetical protein